jgi:hypothetical protein
MKPNKTINQVARDKKYFNFLLKVYLETHKGYTRISISALCTTHKVDSVVVQAMQDLGWIAKMPNQMNYYWRGPSPIESMAEQVQDKIGKIKVVKSVNARNLLAPISPTGKPLIPIIKPTELLKVLQGAPERYLRFLEALYLKTSDTPKEFGMSAMVREYKVGSSVPGSLVKMGLIEKKGGKGAHSIWKWNGAVPEMVMALQVLQAVNTYVLQYVNKKKNADSTKISPAIPQRFHEQLKATLKKEVEVLPEAMVIAKEIFPEAKHTTVVINTTPQKDIKYKLAMKLIDLGEFERAEKLLNEL